MQNTLWAKYLWAKHGGQTTRVQRPCWKSNCGQSPSCAKYNRQCTQCAKYYAGNLTRVQTTKDRRSRFCMWHAREIKHMSIYNQKKVHLMSCSGHISRIWVTKWHARILIFHGFPNKDSYFCDNIERKTKALMTFLRHDTAS